MARQLTTAHGRRTLRLTDWIGPVDWFIENYIKGPIYWTSKFVNDSLQYIVDKNFAAIKTNQDS